MGLQDLFYEVFFTSQNKLFRDQKFDGRSLIARLEDLVHIVTGID